MGEEEKAQPKRPTRPLASIGRHEGRAEGHTARQQQEESAMRPREALRSPADLLCVVVAGALQCIARPLPGIQGLRTQRKTQDNAFP